MASREPSSSSPSSNFPPSMGAGARPPQPGENGKGSLLQEISAIRSHYNVHVENSAINLSYQLNDRQRSYRIPFEKMPIGNSAVAACYGTSDSATITGTLLIDMIRGCENITGTPVTQTEAEGLAFYGTRRMETMYFGQVVGLGIGAFAAWRSRKNMKFPFMKAKAPEKYENFPARFLPILKGGYARFMWQITRANIYIAMWLFVTSPFFRSVADTRMTVGLYADERTNDLTTRIKGNFDRLRTNRAQQAVDRIKGVSTPQPTSDSQAMSDSQASDESSPQSFYGSQSSSGQGSYSADSTYTDGNTDTGLITDAAISRRDTQNASPNSWSEAQSRGSRSSQNQQSQQSSQSSDFFFDDASPTAGNDPDMGTSQPYRQQGGPGAWDRLRRSGPSQSSVPSARQSTSTSAPTRDTPDFETKSDSFSFSSSEEERRLAKDQAQKEFDKMLEKERNEGGSAEYARGMRSTEPGTESSPSADSGSAWSKRRGQ